MPDYFNIPLREVDEAIQKYMKENGRAPTTKSGDASDYLGLPRSWYSIDTMLQKHHKTTLHRRSTALGLPTAQAQRDEAMMRKVEEAARAYARDHGHSPNQHSGDASAYFGEPKRWSGVDGFLRRFGSSLTKLAAK